MNVAIIPARGGSRRIQRKNIRMFHGKPIIAYSIETAKASGLFDSIVVSTDSEEIGDVAREYGAMILMRVQEMAEDSVGTQDVIAHVLRQLQERGNNAYDYACCIYATAPLMTVDDLGEGCGWMGEDLVEYAMAVGADPLRDAGQWYWGSTRAFLEGFPLIAPYTRMVPIPEERVCDINTEEDWKRCEMMYAALHDLPMTATEVLYRKDSVHP